MTDLLDNPASTETWCEGKKSFRTADEARRIARRSSGRHDAPIVSYRCKNCGYWHNGQSARAFKKMKIVRRR